jgi:excinuclease ABC subunit A
LVEKGNPVNVIEHNLDVIKSADPVIDLGPEGGAAGGRVIVAGTPEQVAKSAESYTGHYLRPVLARAAPAAPPRKRRGRAAAKETRPPVRG